MIAIIVLCAGWCAIIPAFLYAWHRLGQINRQAPKPPMIYPGKPRLVSRTRGVR